MNQQASLGATLIYKLQKYIVVQVRKVRMNNSIKYH